MATPSFLPAATSTQAPAHVDVVLAVGLAIASGGLLRHHGAEVLIAAFGAGCLACLACLSTEKRGTEQKGIEKRRRAVVLAGFVVLGLSLGWVRAVRAVAAHERALVQLDEDAPGIQRCDGTVEILTSPVETRRIARWTGRVTFASCGDREVRGPFLATFYDDERRPFARGDQLSFVAQLGPPERLSNFDLSDPVPFEARRGAVRTGGLLDLRLLSHGRGPFSWIDRARAHVRARIEATFPADTAPMARAMVLGENDLAPGDDAAFRGSGLSHLLAVSGMHLVLVVLGLTEALRAVLVRIEAIAARIDAARVASAIGIFAAFLYADFAGGSGSAFRAAWMTTAILLARVLGRRGDGARALGLSIAGMSLHDPLVAHDLSFVLSVLATVGLFVLSPPIEAALARVPRLPAMLARPLATTLGATLACAPVLSSLSSALPAGGVLANLLAVPLGEMVSLPLCLVHALLAPFPSVERGCALVASLGLNAVRAIARTFSQIEWLSVPLPPPTSAQLAVLSVALLAWVLVRGTRRVVALVGCLSLLLAFEVEARARGAPTGILRITFLDVGQGDAALIDLPNGEAMMVDAGGIVGSPVDVGARVIAPTFRARRRDALSIAVLSHPHPDHFGGFAMGLAALRIGALWDTGQGEREGMGGGYATLLETLRAKGAQVERPESLCGTHIVGGATVDVLAPCPGPSADRGPNDNSLVLRVGYGSRHVLFTGDAEHDEEADLVRLPHELLRADVLKVGHHGSRTSTSPALVSAVAPRHAVISAGARNRFGHPSGVTLETLNRANVRIWRTDRDGAVTIETDGRSLIVEAAADAK